MSSDSRYRFNAERLAYWYLRLNGFLSIENFILHDENTRSQRTEIDLIVVRFPYRREALRNYNDVEDYMKDDPRFAKKEKPFAAFVEVTTGRCKLNGPWTDRKKQNLPRALRALGAVPQEMVDTVANQLYEQGWCDCSNMEIGVISIGRGEDGDLRAASPRVEQILWHEILSFIYERFHKYGQIKREHPQWDKDGHKLWEIFCNSRSAEQFTSAIEPS